MINKGYEKNQLCKRDSIMSTLAAVVLLQLKFSQPFKNVVMVVLWHSALSLPFPF